MANEAFGRFLPLRGHHQRSRRQLGTHVIRIDQPTILRVARSSAAARYNHPSPVAM